jgi:hypothetical protein
MGAHVVASLECSGTAVHLIGDAWACGSCHTMLQLLHRCQTNQEGTCTEFPPP